MEKCENCPLKDISCTRTEEYKREINDKYGPTVIIQQIYSKPPYYDNGFGSEDC